MKKIIVTIMVAMAALIAAPAMAQTQSTTTQEQTCQKNGKECKGKKGCNRKGKKCKKGKKCCRKASESPAFQGVEMTAAQQSQVDTICSQAHAAFKVTCIQAKEAMAKEIDMKVKEVLTPEQFTVYKSNKAQIKERKKAKCTGQEGKDTGKNGAK